MLECAQVLIVFARVIVWWRSLNTLWRKRLRPHPLMSRIVFDSRLLLGVIGLCTVDTGAGEGLLVVLHAAMLYAVAHAIFVDRTTDVLCSAGQWVSCW